MKVVDLLDDNIYFVRPRNRHEFEVMGCLALFVLVIITLIAMALYEHGYLGVAVAGGVAVSVGLIRQAFRVWVAWRNRAKHRRREQEKEGRRKRLRLEQQRQSKSRGRPVRSVPQKRRQMKQRRKDQLKRNALRQRLDEMSDEEFKRLMEPYFRHQGYTVDKTPGSVNRGADLIIAATDRRIAILLKRQDVPVSNEAIQEALAGRAFYGAYEAWLITNNTFTRGARKDATVAGVRLIDGSELAEWLSKLLDQPEDQAQ
jgi:restriction system protein